MDNCNIGFATNPIAMMVLRIQGASKYQVPALIAMRQLQEAKVQGAEIVISGF